MSPAVTTESREPRDEPPIAKRLIIGDPLTSHKLDDQLLPKKMALPIFASDALSSVAYAPQELLMILLTGGLAFLAFTPWVALAVVVVLAVVVISYRQLIKAYPSGGGDYEVASKNLGEIPGVDRRLGAARRLRPDGRGVGRVGRRQHHLGDSRAQPRPGRARRSASSSSSSS